MSAQIKFMPRDMNPMFMSRTAPDVPMEPTTAGVDALLEKALGPPRKSHHLNAVQLIGYDLPTLRLSRHRSARVRKKLHKRLSRPIFKKLVLQVSDKVHDTLEEMAAIFNRSKTNG